MTTKTYLLLLLLLICLPAAAQRLAVLIHEIMADPEPSIGLPPVEYVELRNTSAVPIHLAGWRLQTASSSSGAFTAYTLQPDSLVVLTSRANAAFFGPNTIGITSFPALPNGGGTLVLRNAAGMVMHAVAYQPGWYGNPVKAEGGWSLEMIDATNPCGGGNWKAAEHPAGGTPGRVNSVAGPNKDETPPSLLFATAPDSLQLLLHFDEPVDSSAAAIASRYQLQPQAAVAAVVPQGPLYQQVLLRLQTPLQPGTIYTITATAMMDCAGNEIGSRNSVPAGMPQPAAAGDVVINEILFNPRQEGKDYVELYNRGKKIIDASKLWIANENAPNAPANPPQRIAQEPLYLFPGRYAVLTESPAAVLHQYFVKDAQALWGISSMPSLPDDKGSFVLLNEQGHTIDELRYDHNWHFALISNAEGVALERIDPAGPTQKKDNWTSAAASAGWGTPTYQNAQFGQQGAANAVLHITPQVFSPDGDAFDDFCTVTYQFSRPNYVANLRIFDIHGRQVRHLVQNETLAQSGFWRWDGLNDSKQPLPTGTYVLLLELFHLQGKKEQVKKTVVLARK